MSIFFRGLGAQSGPRRGTTRRRRQFYPPFLFSLIFATAAGCSSNPVADPTEVAPTVSHVHALVTNPADGSLLAGTHQGVFKIKDGRATLIGKSRQDTMGLAVLGPDRFYASGHPEAGADSPPHLGLIVSADGAKTWKTSSLAGQADFHTLVPTSDGVYGYNSVKSMLMFSRDGKEWADLFEGGIYDVAADPHDPRHLLLTTEEGVKDYRRGSEPVLRAGTSGIALLKWADRRTVVGLTAGGEVLVSTDIGRTWSKVGSVSGDIEALGTSAKGWQVATANGIFESTDKGETWHSILKLP